jgi:hypothetical protein
MSSLARKLHLDFEFATYSLQNEVATVAGIRIFFHLREGEQ